MDGGGIDLTHPPTALCPLGGGGVYIVRDWGDPTALIPCDFEPAGCSAVVGL